MLRDVVIPITSLSDADLNAAIEKQVRLLHTLGPKLPDNGARLQVYLDKLTSELNIRAKSPPAPPQVFLNRLKSIKKEEPDSVVSTRITKKKEELNSCTTKTEILDGQPVIGEVNVLDLSEQLSGLVIHSDEADEAANVQEDLSTIPSISLKEAIRLRYLLGLPALVIHSFRWFIFSLRFLKDLAFLAVLDGANPDRQFVRVGPIVTWFPGSRIPNRSTSPVDNTEKSVLRISLTQPAEAVRDFWDFISDPNTTSVPDANAPVPCLICHVHSCPDEGNDLIWFSRLLRNTRHYNVARATMPRDCRFVATSAISNGRQSEQRISTENGTDSDQSNSDLILRELRQIRDELFVEVKKDHSDEKILTFRHYNSPHEFMKAGITRSLPWMEASLELEFFKELKEASTLADRLERSVCLGSVSTNTPGQGLHNVPSAILRRLASVGLGRTRLTRLAGLAGWYGFAGLLAFRFSPAATPKTEQPSTESVSNENRESSAFVTDDLQILQDLYFYFRRINGHMDRHNRYYCEDKNNRAPFKFRVLQSGSTFPVVDNPVRVHAWVAGGNALFHPNAQRQSRVLSIAESVDLMKKAQQAYQEARMKRELPTYPSIPPNSSKLYRYRDIRRDSESDTESSQDEDSSDSELPDPEASSTISEKSLDFEDVD